MAKMLHQIVRTLTAAGLLLSLVASVSAGVLENCDVDAAALGLRAARSGITCYQSSRRVVRSTQYLAESINADDQGIQRDQCECSTEALKWYLLSAAHGEAAAQFNLGLIYATGKGVPQDYAEAIKWYRLAAEQGFADAQYNLGLLYAKGEGVARDLVQAYLWLELAATQGSADSAKARDETAALMTPAQIGEARRLADAWVAAHRP
jgi:TPR repeat protein